MSQIFTLTPADHIRGNNHALIELIEYGDYQCPHCARAYKAIRKIHESFESDLKFVFRNFPLFKIHPQAKLAAVAAEAAGNQGKYWEMHDLLFENQRNLLRRSIFQYAEMAGLDLHQFEHDLDSDAFDHKISSDFDAGIRSGVSELPGVFINGEKYSGDRTLSDLPALIQLKLESLDR